MAMAMATMGNGPDISEYWDVVGEIDCGTRLVKVSELLQNDKSQLWLDIKAKVTVVPLPRHLEDEEDLEDHFNVMLMEDDQAGQCIDFEFEDKLELDLLMEDRATSLVARTISHELCKLIHVPSRSLLSAAAAILRDARASARDKSLVKNVVDGCNKLVHMEASIKLDVVEEEVLHDDHEEPAFVPARKSLIDKLERVRVEAWSPEVCCSICIADIVVGSDAIRMPCSHLYHESCIIEWLEKSRFCPLCRFSVSDRLTSSIMY